jgi:hypothetical protein
MIMRNISLTFVLALLALVGMPRPLHANTIAIACNEDALTSAISAASSGDTIAIPSGCTISLTSAGLTIAKALRIVGLGIGAAIERSPAPGMPSFRLIDVVSGGELTLENLTLRNGYAGYGRFDRDGGGIRNNASLILINTQLIANHAGGKGGGIYNFGGHIVLRRSVLSGNSAGNGIASDVCCQWGSPGGGLYSEAGTVTLIDSTVSSNYAGNGADNYGGSGGDGGGIASISADVILIGSTVSENRSGNGGSGRAPISSSISPGGTGGNGGGIAAGGGSLVLINSTIGQNRTGIGGVGIGLPPTQAVRAPNGLGGLFINGGSAAITSSTISENSQFGVYSGTTSVLTVTNTIIIGNYDDSGEGTDCAINPMSASLRGNLFGEGRGCPLSSDNLAVAPEQAFSLVLRPLGSYGGSTQTYGLQAGSPAIDRIELADCTADHDADANTPNIPLTADQRGVARPQGLRCDIGAYEFDGFHMRMSLILH